MSNLKSWVIIDDLTILEIIFSNKRPLDSLSNIKDPITGFYEEAAWLQVELEDIVDDDGLTVGQRKILTVNQTLKDSILAQREADRLQADIDRQDEQNRLKDIDKNVKLIRSQNITDINGIRQAIDYLTEAVKELNKKVINLEDNG